MVDRGGHAGRSASASLLGKVRHGKTDAVAVARHALDVHGTPYTELDDTDELGRERVWFITGRPDLEAPR